jgi:hypothetical protein
MVENIMWCIMNTTIFYVSMFIFLYHQFNGNTEMSSISFQAAVLLGISAILNRR